jgi:hypothetical protein
MAGVVRIPWYATVFRGDAFADAVAELSPLALRYGATRYAVHRSLDDKYRIDQMLWFDSKDDWYRFWESDELIEFRARFMGRYQVPLVYVWHEEIAAGELGPQVGVGEPQPAPAGGLPGSDGGGPALPNGGQPTSPSPAAA